MHSYFFARRRGQAHTLASFTLVELLTVIAIIAILAALVIYAGAGVMQKAARSRATTEIQAMSTALEAYKNDNGVYPQASLLLTNTPYTSTDGSVAGGLYQQSSQLLYEALSGKTNYNDPPPTTRAYLNFKANQLGNTTTSAGTLYAAGTSTFIRDPWNYSYGYSTGTAVGAAGTPFYPFNGTGFYDLWTTGNMIGNTSATGTNTWIANFPL